jgi:hypothetical protein
MTTYAIRGGAEGKRRLDLLAQTMAPTTNAADPRSIIGFPRIFQVWGRRS